MMTIIETTDETVSDQYSPILEQVAEQYRPRREPVMGQHHPKNGQVVYPHSPINGQALVSTINNTKQVNIIKEPKGWQAVINFFIEKSFTADEGKKFFEYYENRNWHTSDGKEIRDWRALATNWMNRSELFNDQNKTNKKTPSQFKDNLRTTKTKDYGQPL